MNNDISRDDVMRETLKHKNRVADLMASAIDSLVRRAIHHDDSKFSDDEFPAFAEATPKLKNLTYGSDEYRATLRAIKPAIAKHYARNSHHPEHAADGVNDMTLLDILEMLADWKAAGERHADGCLDNSFDINRERFAISPQLEQIMKNTARHLCWIESPIPDEAAVRHAPLPATT